MDIEELNNELNELLHKHPHLMDLQFEISKNLAKFDSFEGRCYYLAIELFDSFYELKEELGKLDKMLKELK